jgi:uncharacterized DUF497 family protein
VEFEWDINKADSNLSKHGVSFEEAMTVFGDIQAATGFDPAHSIVEDRYLTMGLSNDGRLLVVSHTDRGDRIRIISARPATRRESKVYNDANYP